MTKVFVYGSLLSGMGNHRLLENSKCIGKTKTTKRFKMLSLGAFPGIVEDDQGDAITGEVYEVDDVTLSRVNRLEGYSPDSIHNNFYNRIEIDTEFGKAFVYTINGGFGGTAVPGGDWKTYYNGRYRG